MKTDLDTGTSDDNVAPAFMNYFKSVGLFCNAYLYYGTESGRDIIGEINNGRPSELLLHNNKMYIDHVVLALEYKQYTYFLSTSNYIRIADGWISSPSRFVWGGCNGIWNYVAVVPS